MTAVQLDAGSTTDPDDLLPAIDGVAVVALDSFVPTDEVVAVRAGIPVEQVRDANRWMLERGLLVRRGDATP